MILGIDEAGRGPVIGPLVIAGCLTTPEIDLSLKELGIKDSKLILPKKREMLFEIVKQKVLAWEIIVVYPDEIDAALNNPDLNLNKLEAITSSKIIKLVIEKKGNNFSVMLDSPTNTPAPYIEFVNKLIQNKVKVNAEIKADLNYPSVSAASILAKVTRDKIIKKMESEVIRNIGKIEIGSGYPADPKTKFFVDKYWNKIDFVKGGFFRKTWSTWKNAKNKNTSLQRNMTDF